MADKNGLDRDGDELERQFDRSAQMTASFSAALPIEMRMPSPANVRAEIPLDSSAALNRALSVPSDSQTKFACDATSGRPSARRASVSCSREVTMSLIRAPSSSSASRDATAAS